MPSPTSDVMRRRERANAFCESIRALDATGLLFFRTGKFLFLFPVPIFEPTIAAQL